MMAAALGLVAACGGGGGASGGTGASTYQVQVSVTRLDGSGLVLQNNGGDDLAVTSNGSKTFATRLADGAPYAVTVKTQPNMLRQTCSVSSGSGTVAGAAVTSVTVDCVTPTPLFAFTANSDGGAGGAGSVSAYRVGTAGTLVEAKTAGNWVGVAADPKAVQVDANGGFLYVASSSDAGVSALSAFAIDTSGVLTARSGGASFSSVAYPQVMGLSADGTRLYVAGTGISAAPKLAVHSIAGSGGGLGTATLLDLPLGSDPRALAVDPLGRYVIVAVSKSGANALVVFKRNADGSLTAWTNPVPVPYEPGGLVIDPGGRWLYATFHGTASTASQNLLRVYDLPAASGGEVLAQRGIDTQVVGGLVDVAVHPRGNFVYALRQSQSQISVFPINGDGTLGSEATASPSSNHGTGLTPFNIRLDAAGTYAYVSNTGGNTVSIYSVNSSTGLLTPMSPATVGTDTSPVGLVLFAR